MMGDWGGVGVTVMLDPLPNRGRTVGLIDKELSGGQGVVAMRLPGRVYRDPRLGLALEDVVAVPPHAKTTFAQTARSHVPSVKRLRGKGGGWGRCGSGLLVMCGWVSCWLVGWFRMCACFGLILFRGCG